MNNDKRRAKHRFKMEQKARQRIEDRNRRDARSYNLTRAFSPDDYPSFEYLERQQGIKQ